MFIRRCKTVKISPLLLIASLLLMAACSNTPKQSLSDGSAQAANSQAAEQWRCEGDENKQWQCRDMSKATDETTEETAVKVNAMTASPAVVQTSPAATTAPAPAVAIPATAAVATSNPYENDTYVVQLIAAREAVTIERFKQQNPQVAAKPLTVEKNGEQWLVLILGTYVTYDEAQAAVAAIEPALANPPWIRPIAPLRDKLNIQH